MIGLKDITIVIPSYNRPDLLRRCIKFWSQTKVSLIILDGSSPELKLSNQDISHDRIQYIHDQNSFFKRIRISRSLVKSKYVTLLSDDEYFIPSAMVSCINELERHPNLISCIGQCLGFWELDGEIKSIRLYKKLQGYCLNDNSGLVRMKKHMKNYVPSSLYSIMKREHWIKCIDAMTSSVFDVYAIGELQFELASAYYGNSKSINELLWLRSLETHGSVRGEKGLDPSKKFRNWWGNDTNVEEKKDFLKYMSIQLSKGGNEDHVIIRTVEGALDLFYNNSRRWGFLNVKAALFRKIDELKGLDLKSLSGKLNREGIIVDTKAVQRTISSIEEYYNLKSSE